MDEEKVVCEEMLEESAVDDEGVVVVDVEDGGEVVERDVGESEIDDVIKRRIDELLAEKLMTARAPTKVAKGGEDPFLAGLFKK